jgi:hypothetical protein
MIREGLEAKVTWEWGGAGWRRPKEENIFTQKN